jgi:hypothetical protein
MSDRVLTDHKEASTTQTQLDGLVVNIELTLISIIQGVAFSFLADRSRDVLVGLQLVSLPYAVTGLLIILLFWSRSLIHTLTVIRWPLDFAHNFMYIACTLVETVAFTQLTSPLQWYALNTLFALMLWVLFALDLRMVRRRVGDSSGLVAGNLYSIVEREQLVNIRLLMPATVGFNFLAMVAVRLWPESLVKENGHVWIALIQLAAAIGYLRYVVRFFGRIIPLIAKTREEWRDEVVS